MTLSNVEKLRLLLWKNWRSQTHHKCQLMTQLLAPALLSFTMVLLRIQIIPIYQETFIDKDVSMDNLDLLKKALESHEFPNPLKYHLAYSPQSPIYDKIVKQAAESLKLTYSAHANAAALEEILIETNYLAGVEFEDSTANIKNFPKKLSYRLRFPSEQRTAYKIDHTWFTNLLFAENTLEPRNDTRFAFNLPTGPNYLREGFLPVQNAISMAFITQSVKDLSRRLPQVFLQRFPQPEHIDDYMHAYLSYYLDTILLLSFGIMSMFTVKYIVAEKEKQLREVMKIMGLQNWLHWTAWFVKTLLTMGLSSFLKAIILKVKWTNNVAILSNSSFTAVFFFFLVFAVVSITLCFMLAAFFTRANTAATTTGLIFFVTHLPYYYLDEHYSSLTTATKIASSLVSNTAMGFAIKIIVAFESNGEGLQWSNMFTPVSVDDHLAMGHVICMMIVASVLQMFICLYVEQIYPGEFGVPKPWNFPFSKAFWHGEQHHSGIEDLSDHVMRTDPGAFEIEPEGKSIGIHVKNLSKSFGDVKALKGLSLNMYENEITVLLGANGSGKSIIVSLLTGMIPPTSGTAIINGNDIRTNMDDIRKSLSFCPQRNIFFDELTVRDHLIFYSRLKGLKGDKLETEVTRFIKKIELENKANVAASKLSGGTQRKLSVCSALCGNTKVVLLDEASAGMDPMARRQVWDLLQSEKEGRTILLTTHMMDEADVLGDRIAIMFAGDLQCLGTPLFLKKKFGNNYQLICEKGDKCDSAKVTSLLNKYIPGIQPELDTGAELCYELHDSYSHKFEQMFHDLESHSKELALDSYGVSITSLEQVFMKVGAEPPLMSSVSSDDIFRDGTTFSDNQYLLKGFKLMCNQWRSMILKKYLYTIRSKIILAVQNIVPVLYIVRTLSGEAFPQLPPIILDFMKYPWTVTVLETNPNVQIGSVEAKISDNYKNIISSYGSDHQLEQTEGESFVDYILKLGETIQVRINKRYIASATVNNGRITAWYNQKPMHSAPLTVNLIHNAMARSVIGPSASIVVTNAPLPYSAESIFYQLISGHNLGTRFALQFCYSMALISALYVIFVIMERQNRVKLLQFVGGVRILTFWLSHFIWDLLMYTLTLLISIMMIVYCQIEGYSTFDEIGRYMLILMLFGCSVIPYTYLMANLFKEAHFGYSILYLINMCCGKFIFIAMLKLGPTPFAEPNRLNHIFLVSPFYTLSWAFNKLFLNSKTWKICEPLIKTTPDAIRCKLFPHCCELTPFFAWKSPGVLVEITSFIVTSVLFFLALILKEYRVLNMFSFNIKRICKCLISRHPSSQDDEHDEDDDVKLEKERIQNMSEKEISLHNLVLDRVTKVYGHLVAVNQISVGVKHSECFGLLGVNGAGKTVIFKMLTGEEKISSGEAYVKGLSLKRAMSNVYKEIGYCPQFGSLFKDFTGRETLKIFSLLRGIPAKKIPRVTMELANYFDFIQFYDKRVRSYSGGYKRKLSAAIAVLGSPSVLYLDEPTTGMDQIGCHKIWNIVCRIRDAGKAIVLTTHSMAECEALCTRLAIMVNGKFKCIGSTHHLRNKFAKGFILKVKLKHIDLMRSIGKSVSAGMDLVDADVQKVMNFIKKEFPQAFLKERFQALLTFYIPLSKIQWSGIFGLIEKNKTNLNIEDYSISQTTLEEVFLQFPEHQWEDSIK